MEDYGISLLCGCTLLMQQIIVSVYSLSGQLVLLSGHRLEEKEIPRYGDQRVSAVLAILVFVSTLLTKQHVLVDVAEESFLQNCVSVSEETQICTKFTKDLAAGSRKRF